MNLFQLQLGCYKTWQKILDMLFCSARKSPLSVSLFPVKIEGVQNIFCCLFFGLRFSIFVWLSFLVTSALYLQQFGTRIRIRHFAWYLLHFGMVTLHFAWYLLHLAMSAFHFTSYLLHFGTSNVHVGVLKVSLGCHLGFHLGFRVMLVTRCKA